MAATSRPNWDDCPFYLKTQYGDASSVSTISRQNASQARLADQRRASFATDTSNSLIRWQGTFARWLARRPSRRPSRRASCPYQRAAHQQHSAQTPSAECCETGESRRSGRAERRASAQNPVSVLVSVGSAMRCMAVRGAAREERPETCLNTGNFRCAAFGCARVQTGQAGF